jgi:hypothetical protein
MRLQVHQVRMQKPDGGLARTLQSASKPEDRSVMELDRGSLNVRATGPVDHLLSLTFQELTSGASLPPAKNGLAAAAHGRAQEPEECARSCTHVERPQAFIHLSYSSV